MSSILYAMDDTAFERVDGEGYDVVLCFITMVFRPYLCVFFYIVASTSLTG